VSLAERRWLRLFTLCVLYIAQGIPWGFMASTLPSYLVSRGVEDIGTVVAMTYLPFAFKWVWGPVIDAFTIPRFGRRRPWIVFAQGMMALTVVAMVTFDVTRYLQLLVQMIFLHTVFNSIQDVAVDALAVDLLPDNERGRANGLMYGSKYVGGALGGFGMAWLITRTSLNTALIAQTCVLVAIMLVPLLVRERDGAPPAREPVRAIVGALVQAFSLRSTLVAAVLMMCATLASGIMVPTATKLFVGELHWKVDAYGAISGGWGLVVGGVCAAITGFLADLFGRKRIAAVASCGLAAGWLLSSLMRSYWTETWFVWAVALYTEACLAIWSVSLFAIAMDLSWPRIAGSQFTAYMALLNVGTAVGSLISTRLMQLFEFYGIYVLGACVQLAITLLLWPIDLGETRRKLPLPEGTRPRRFAIVSLFVLLAIVIAVTISAIRKLL
jgi:MFS transporter, PAT family, beta-lactamase induction signal transducer AmpG